MPAQLSPDQQKAVSVIVRGRVQGVGFRAFTRRHALLLELTGEVMNLADGTVKAHIEGKQERVNQLLKLIQHGPSLARVDQVVVSPLDPKGKFNSFNVGLSRR